MNIKPGDMVMQVWACCSDARRKHIGRVYTAQAVYQRGTRCGFCNVLAETTVVRVGKRTDGVNVSKPMSWIIKLDPPGVTSEKEKEAVV